MVLRTVGHCASHTSHGHFSQALMHACLVEVLPPYFVNYETGTPLNVHNDNVMIAVALIAKNGGFSDSIRRTDALFTHLLPYTIHDDKTVKYLHAIIS